MAGKWAFVLCHDLHRSHAIMMKQKQKGRHEMHLPVQLLLIDMIIGLLGIVYQEKAY